MDGQEVGEAERIRGADPWSAVSTKGVTNVSRRVSFLSTVLGTAGLMFLAQSVEYAGLEYLKLSGALAVGVGVGTVLFMALAVRMFRHVGTFEMVLAGGCVAGFPFLVDRLLKVNGTQLNVHGNAILGYFIYAFGSEACAAGMIIAVGVRTFMRLKSRPAINKP